MPEPTIGRSVVYRSKLGGYDVPATITATVETLNPAGLDLYQQTHRADREVEGIDLQAQGIPPLSSPDHVHLTVFSPGLPGNDPVDGLDANAGGSYREYDVPLFEVEVAHSPQPGVAPVETEPQPGTWRWPVLR